MTQQLSYTNGLQALAVNKSTTYTYDQPDTSVLERFPSPGILSSVALGLSVHIEVPEFTSLCPLTGQPDFATIVIDYVPRDWCVESKALKLYMMSYRQHGEFHEACVVRMCNDLVKLLSPASLTVEGRFTPRGGIPFWPTASYRTGQEGATVHEVVPTSMLAK